METPLNAFSALTLEGGKRGVPFAEAVPNLATEQAIASERGLLSHLAAGSAVFGVLLITVQDVTVVWPLGQVCQDLLRRPGAPLPHLHQPLAPC